MVSTQNSGIRILLAVLLFITICAFYSLGYNGVLIPISALVFYFLFGLFVSFERALMHASFYFSITMVLTIVLFGLLILIPSWTFTISISLLVLIVFSSVIAIWRWYNGVLGRIQLRRWLS